MCMGLWRSGEYLCLTNLSRLEVWVIAFGSQGAPECLPGDINNTDGSAVLYEAQCSYKIEAA